MGPLRSPDHFETMLRQRHAEHAHEFMREFGAAPTSRGVTRIYALKNRSLELTLDVALGYSGNRLSAWLRWFGDEFASSLRQPPATVLDLGCENGLLTCFYAMLWPDAEVTGVDRVDAARDRARELATKLGLANVRFEKADLARRKSSLVRDIDLAVSTLSLGHEICRDDGVVHEHAALIALRESLRPGGTFVCLERLPTSGRAVDWVRSLEAHGISVDLSRSPTLEFHELGEVQSMPAYVATRREVTAPVASDVIAVALATSASPAHRDEEQLSGGLAAAVFTAIGDKRFVRGAMIADDRSGEASWHELWTSGPLLLFRRWDLGDDGILVFDSAARLPFRLEALEREFGAGSFYSLVGGAEFYDRVEDRPSR